MQDRLTRSQIENTEEWGKFYDTMPFIELPSGYSFRVIPPFNGALMRFKVLTPSSKEYSIYFDAYDRLGVYGEPYYELYPYNEDIYRSTSITDILDAIYVQEN